MKAAQSAVAFVAFRNEIFAAFVPIRVRSQDRNFSAHIVRRMQSAFAKDMGRHGGGGCLAMHSGDHNPAFGLHDCSDGFRATEKQFSATARREENWIVVLNRGGKYNKFRSVGVLSEMLFMKTQAKSLQSLSLCRGDFVRAAHYVPQFEKKRGKTAHTASRNTNEVNPMLFGRQKSRQIG